MKLVTDRLADENAVLVTVVSTQGSAPREAGAWMLVFASDVVGTVGGGHVEHEATARARAQLASGRVDETRRYVLGPSLGQCCGGVMELRFAAMDAAQREDLSARLAPKLAPLALFGGGHVGRALVQALAPLPFAVLWIDSRDEIFPPQVSPSVRCEHSEPVHAAVADLAAQSRVVIMSFSHAEDLDIVAACLLRLRRSGDLPWIGLIGSRTKWATFRHRLEQRGFSGAELARVTCPIGIPGIGGKDPAVIAASVVAQVLLEAPP